MARVTVEDCLRNVKNRFELVMVAAKRARQLMRGKDPKVDWDNDKATVVALREIAAGYTNFDIPEPQEHDLHALHHRTAEPSHLSVIESTPPKEQPPAASESPQESPAAPTATDEE